MGKDLRKSSPTLNPAASTRSCSSSLASSESSDNRKAMRTGPRRTKSFASSPCAALMEIIEVPDRYPHDPVDDPSGSSIGPPSIDSTSSWLRSEQASSITNSGVGVASGAVATDSEGCEGASPPGGGSSTEGKLQTKTATSKELDTKASGAVPALYIIEPSRESRYLSRDPSAVANGDRNG